MERMKRIILANATLMNGNLGCRALANAACALIRETVAGKGDEIEILLPDSNEESAPYYPFPRGIKELVRDVTHPARFLKAWKAFRRADVIFDIGQGDSFSDIYGLRRFAVIDRIHITARLLRKKYVLLPQTIGPFGNPSVKEKAARTLRKAHFVMCRDEESMEYAKSLCPSLSAVDTYTDVAFFLPYERQHFSEQFIHVGVNISALLLNGGYTGGNQFGLKADYRLLTERIIEMFLSMDNVCVHLIPHVLTSFPHVENDYWEMQKIVKRFGSGRLVLAPFFFSPEEAKGYIAGMDFFIGSRMHSTIAAFSAGVPVVPMAYSRKFSGLFESSLNYPFMIDLREKEADECLGFLADAFGRRSELKDMIALRIREIIEPEGVRLREDIGRILYGESS